MAPVGRPVVAAAALPLEELPAMVLERGTPDDSAANEYE